MSDSTRSRILEVMARGIAAHRNPALASDKHWATEVAHYQRMVAEYGDAYTKGRSTMTDAFEGAEAALTAYESHLQAEGMAVVPVEPTDAMVLAGVREVQSDTPQTDTRECWRAMLTASPSMKAGKEESK